jgi:hypothetical protein
VVERRARRRGGPALATLLVLGSKPEPALPTRAEIDALACANASGWSAARLGLPEPDFTVVIAALHTGRRPSHRLALEALRGLGTRKLYVLERPVRRRSALRRAAHALRTLELQPWCLRLALRRVGYRHSELVRLSRGQALALVSRLCGDDPQVAAQLARKRPSTGIFALALGLDDPSYARCVLAGFDFGRAHAYYGGPRRASRANEHLETDVLVLRRLCALRRDLFTTEPAVHERAGVPLLARAAAVRAG